MALRSYYVRDGDTIDGIAWRETGAAANWKSLAEFNRLRYPYISNDVRDYYGPVVAQGLFSVALTPGTTDFPLVSSVSVMPNPTLVENSAPFLVGQYTRDGVFVFDVLTVKAMNAVSGMLTTTTPLVNAYDAQARWYLYAFDRPTGVLRTGDALLIPTGNPETTDIRPIDKLVDFLGTDLAMDDDGYLSWDRSTFGVGLATLTASPSPASPVTVPIGTVLRAPSTNQFFATTAVVTIPHSGGPSVSVDVPIRSYMPGLGGSVGPGLITEVVASMTTTLIHTTITAVSNAERLVGQDGVGDVALATGIQNLKQALLNRLSTKKGEMVNFPAYGNAAFNYLGVPNDKVEAALIEAAVIECIADDDRVSSVTGGNLVRNTDSIAVDVEVLIKTLGLRVTLRELQLSLLR